MISKTIDSKRVARVAIYDVAIVAVACLVPALSHVVGLPLYVFNPMLALLLAGVLLGGNWRNGLLLAVVMPLVSSVMVGMPAGGKVACMIAELATVAAVLGWLGTKWKPFAAALVAVVAGKLVYYILKAVIVAPAVLVGTDWKMQTVAALLWVGVFAAVQYLRGTRRV